MKGGGAGKAKGSTGTKSIPKAGKGKLQTDYHGAKPKGAAVQTKKITHTKEGWR